MVIVKGMTLMATTTALYAVVAALPGVTLPAAAIIGLAAGLLFVGAAYIDFVDWMGHSKGVYARGYAVAFGYIWHN